jgi:hypothetical protein
LFLPYLHKREALLHKNYTSLSLKCLHARQALYH